MKKKKISVKKITEKLSGGFTFVETLAVIAVSSVLACQVSISSMKLVQKGKIAAAKGQIECFRGALQSFYIDCGNFPSEVQGLDALWACPSEGDNSRWNGPYLEQKAGPDPWGNAYQYFERDSARMPLECPEGIPFAIICYGSDGKEGGKGNEKDIVSWE